LRLIERPPARAVQLGPPPLATLGLQKSYATSVVDDVSLFVGTREVVGLLGANGAARRQRFNMIVGLEQPDAGTVRLGERDVTNCRCTCAARLAWLPAAGTFCISQTDAAQNILAVLENDGSSQTRTAQKAEELLEEFGIRMYATRAATPLRAAKDAAPKK